LKDFLRQLNFHWAAALVGEGKGKLPHDLRKTASDTVKEKQPDIFGGTDPRKPSLTKFKVIRINSGHCLLALAPSKEILRKANHLLISKPQPKLWNALGDWNYLVL
jgi:hypothetical protein